MANVAGWLFKFNNGVKHFTDDPTEAASIIAKLEVDETVKELFDKAERSEREIGFDYGHQQGLEQARIGVQTVDVGLDGIPGLPDEWQDKPFCRIQWYEDRGDPSVGIQPTSTWVLSVLQEGTIVGDNLLPQLPQTG